MELFQVEYKNGSNEGIATISCNTAKECQFLLQSSGRLGNSYSIYGIKHIGETNLPQGLVSEYWNNKPSQQVLPDNIVTKEQLEMTLSKLVRQLQGSVTKVNRITRGICTDEYLRSILQRRPEGYSVFSILDYKIYIKRGNEIKLVAPTTEIVESDARIFNRDSNTLKEKYKRYVLYAGGAKRRALAVLDCTSSDEIHSAVKRAVDKLIYYREINYGFIRKIYKTKDRENVDRTIYGLNLKVLEVSKNRINGIRLSAVKQLDDCPKALFKIRTEGRLIAEYLLLLCKYPRGGREVSTYSLRVKSPSSPRGKNK